MLVPCEQLGCEVKLASEAGQTLCGRHRRLKAGGAGAKDRRPDFSREAVNAAARKSARELGRYDRG
jgi:hypothetical protein